MRVVLALTIALVAPSLMSASANAFDDALATQKSEKDRIVCRSAPKTGTRFSSQTCHTVRQWEQIEEQQKRDASDLINRPKIETNRGG